MKRWKTLDDFASLECITWEGHCMLHLVVFCIFSCLSRCGSRYDYVNGEVRHTLLDFAAEKLFHANPLDSVQIMHRQIAKHMRVCVAAEDWIMLFL